jgi:hypothetical protein
LYCIIRCRETFDHPVVISSLTNCNNCITEMYVWGGARAWNSRLDQLIRHSNYTQSVWRFALGDEQDKAVLSWHPAPNRFSTSHTHSVSPPYYMIAILPSSHNFLRDTSGYHGGTPKNICYGRHQTSLVGIYRRIGGICCNSFHYVPSKSRLTSYQTTRSHIPDYDNIVIISNLSILSHFLPIYSRMGSFLFLPALLSYYFLLCFHSTFSIFSSVQPCCLYIRISISNLQFLIFFLFPLTLRLLN